MVVTDVDNLEIAELWPAKLLHIRQLVHVQVQLLEGGQILAYAGDSIQLIAIQRKIAKVVQLDVAWVHWLTSARICLQELGQFVII